MNILLPSENSYFYDTLKWKIYGMNTFVVSVEWLAENLDDKRLIILDASTEINPSGKTTLYP